MCKATREAAYFKVLTEKARREQLTQLRRVAVGAPDDRFDMTTFDRPTPCGTAYCLAGWAAIDPWFREHTEIGKLLSLRDDGRIINHVDGVGIFFALAALFDLTVLDSQYLFGAGMGHVEPRAIPKAKVIENIDRILEGQGAVRYVPYED